MTIAELAPHLQAIAREVPAATRRAMLVVGGNSERLLRDGYLSGARLKVRSGRLRNSVAMHIEQSAQRSTLTVSAGRDKDVRYAAIQEHGGTIRPRTGKFLAIPVGRARTGAGVTRGGWESPRTAPAKLRFVAIRGGTMGRLVIDDGGKGKRSETVYLLVRSVTIRGKHFMRDTEAAARAAFPEVMASQMLRLFERAR